MSKLIDGKYLLLQLLMLSGHLCFSQTVPAVPGKVMDVNGRSPVQWVKVLNSSSQKYTYTDHQGEFEAFAEIGDTLIFSLSNFKTKTAVLSSIPKDPWVIYMEFDAKELPEVQVMEKNENTTVKLQGLKEVDPDHVPIKPGDVSAGATEDYRPGVSMAGPISFFSKSERYKRKYQEAQEIRESQKGYLDVIHSDSMRKELKIHFSLSREKYDSLLILFNSANRHHLFKDIEKERVEKMLFYFMNDAIKQ